MMKKSCMAMFLLVVLTAVLAACSTPAPTEVTRIVTQEIPVTVEVTREVIETVTVETTVEVPVEVEVEVTRIVEVAMVVTATPDAEPTTMPTVAPAATTVPAVMAKPTEGNYYTVQSGDSLTNIAQKTGVSAEEIMAANNMSNANVLVVGQELLIPGWTGGIVASEQPSNPTPNPEQPTAPAGANLLPNGSFEEDWYFFQGVSEWQLPNGWSMSVDEGSNSSGSGGLFLRPEIRLLSRPDLPPAEANLFVMDGIKTIKAFKGDAPTSFAIFRDVPLGAGKYRLTVRFVPDSVMGYSDGKKVYNNDPASAEARIIVGNGGTGWTGTNVGSQNTATYDFTLDAAQTIRLGAAFRNRFGQSNNGWFIDDWSLQKLD